MYYLDITMDKVRCGWPHAVPSCAFGSEDPALQVPFLNPFGCHLGQKLQPLSSLTSAIRGQVTVTYEPGKAKEMKVQWKTGR